MALGDICEFKYGKALPASVRTPGPVAVFGSNGTVGTHDRSLTNGPAIVVGRKGSFGEVNFSDVACWPIDTTYYVDRTVTEQDLGWLRHVLPSLRLKELNRAAAVPGLNREDAYRRQLLLPPIEEQRRIAVILDHTDGLLRNGQALIAQLGLLRSALFICHFGAPSTWAERWRMGSISDITEEARYGTSAKAAKAGTYPVLRMGNLTYDGRLDLSDLKYMELGNGELNRYTVRRGDILFNRTNSADLVGKTAVVRTDERLAYAGYLVRLRLADGNQPEFVSGYLNSRHGKAVLRGMCKSIVGQANINAREMQSIRVPIPPPAVQLAYSNDVTAVYAQEAVAVRRRDELTHLLESLQARAFSGRL